MEKIEETAKRLNLTRTNVRGVIYHVLTDPEFVRALSAMPLSPPSPRLTRKRARQARAEIVR